MLRRLGQRSLSYVFSIRDDVCDQRIVLSLPCAPDVFFFGAVFRGSELDSFALVQVYNIHVCKERS